MAVFSSKTRAVMPVHLYNNMVQMADLNRWADENGLSVIEDSAEAFSMFQNEQHAGTFGRFGIFSFFANKTITCAEGGVVLTDSAERYQQLYRIKNHGRDRRGTFVHEHFGYNFCFTDLQAAIGLAQLEKLERIQTAKQRNYDVYLKAFADLEPVSVVEPDSNVSSNYWFNNILVRDPESLQAQLHEQGIGTRRYFYPMDRQPCFANMDQPLTSFPNSQKLYEHGLSIPSGSTLTDDELAYVCEKIREACSKDGSIEETLAA